MLLNNPMTDPNPTFMDLLGPEPASISPKNAPRNGPIINPKAGITNGPIIKPMVLPHIEALEPPSFLTPRR